MLCQIVVMQFAGRLSGWAVCIVLLCGTIGPFLPATLRAQAAPGTADFDPTNPSQVTLVRRGETLFNIAERTRSPLRALIDVNGLSPPYILTPGQTLRLPPLKVHVVIRGETFSEIARRYSVDERSLAVFNRLARPVQTQVGQRIILPPTVIDRFTGLEPQDLVELLANELDAGREVTGSIPGQISRNTEASAPQTGVTSPLSPQRQPQPQGAENQGPQLPLGPPLQRAGPSVDDAANPIATPATQTASPSREMGPRYDLDGAITNPVSPRPLPKRAATAPQQRPQSQLAALPPPPQRPSRPPHNLPGVTDMPVPMMSGIFFWPITGRVIERFGPRRDLRTYDGIEIEAAAGTPFKAAASGKVVYVGNQIPGYGWLVLIRHDNDLMSAYAYAQSVSVRENQNVTRGQTIGLVGTTGRAATPRLHFQIRYNTRPVDPLPRLPQVRATV